jgi:hypothetical protein
MMGQQHTVEAGDTLKRMILALTVAALMVAMMVATAAPAFANNGKHRGEYLNDFNGGSTTGWYNGGDYYNDYNGNNGRAKGDDNN